MRKLGFVVAAVLLVAFFSSSAVEAGAKLVINDDAYIDLGFRLQVLDIYGEKDRDGDGDYESEDTFRARRARFRLKGVVNEHVSIFLQTDIVGTDVRLIDGFMTLKKDNWKQIILGLNMAPILRQNLTSSGVLLAGDRPGMAYRSLTWGARSVSAFATTVYFDGAAGLTAGIGVRDLGATFFGSGEVGENMHLKYYAGIYNGIQAPGRDSERYTGRVQLNLGDAEAGYYNLSHYLGKKNTLGFGIGYDTQGDVAISDAGGFADYSMITFDFFGEKPIGDGSFVFEGAYIDLDLGGAPNFNQVQGDGFYIQVGYLVGGGKWQPWFAYEDWGADAASGKGSYDMVRAGVTYYIAGHNANIKFGYEQFNTDALIGTSSEDSVGTAILGFYVTY